MIRQVDEFLPARSVLAESERALYSNPAIGFLSAQITVSQTKFRRFMIRADLRQLPLARACGYRKPNPDRVKEYRSLIGSINSLIPPKTSLFGRINSLFRCVGNFSASH
jgi:hypothetical protein